MNNSFSKNASAFTGVRRNLASTDNSAKYFPIGQVSRNLQKSSFRTGELCLHLQRPIDLSHSNLTPLGMGQNRPLFLVTCAMVGYD
jgi:hypothetical protein